MLDEADSFNTALA